MIRVTESFKVHLTEADIYQMEDQYAEALLESEACCVSADGEGVYVWFSVEIAPAAPEPEAREAARDLGLWAASAFMVWVVMVGSMLCWEMCCG